MWLVDLNYNFECHRLIELSGNKLSNNNLASELVEKRSFFKRVTVEEIVIFMISPIIIAFYKRQQIQLHPSVNGFH